MCILFLSSCALKESKPALKESQKETSVVDFSDTPTVFLHGAGGGRFSLGGMIKRLSKQEVATKALIIKVSSEGVVSVDKSFLSDNEMKDNPMIQVLFEDNRNNEWEQAAWIKSVLEFLQQNYDVKEVNLVGHSMGGISGFRYLLQDGENVDLPKVNKLVAIGSPFNEFLDTLTTQSLDELLSDGPSEKSERYILYQNELAGMPEDVKVLLIAGKMSDEDLSDKTVPLSSALAIHAMLKQLGNDVKEDIIEGNGADHSGLHENSEVDELVSQFLWNKK